MKRGLTLACLLLAMGAALWADAIDDELTGARQGSGASGRALSISLGSGLFDGSSDLFARLTVRLDPVSRLVIEGGCLVHDDFWAAHGACGLAMGSPSLGGVPRVYGGPLVAFYLPDRVMDQGFLACVGLYGFGGAEVPINEACGLYLEFGGGKVLSAYTGPAFGDGAFLRGGMYLCF
jgi:hypothetical protein